MHKLIMTAVLGFAALQPVAALAQESDTYVVSIPASDLNLASPAGAQALRGRAARAARLVCGESQRLEDLYAQDKCRQNFISQVDTRIASTMQRGTDNLASR